MKSKPIWEYIGIGTGFRYLQDSQAGNSVHGQNFTKENLNRFLKTLDDLDLQVTKRAAFDLSKLRDELSNRPADAKLTVQNAKSIHKLTTDLRKTLRAETLGSYVYVVTPKRIDLQRLLESVTELLAPKTFEQCPDIAKYDLSEAGKCIAFERPTAAASHLMRAVVAILFNYYKMYIKPATTGLTWGQMTTALANKTRGKRPDKVILANLDHIRIAFRNPTQHPDKIYDIQEAQDLFGLCIDAINRMVKAMHP